MTKGEIITNTIERFGKPIRVLEIGRIRNNGGPYEKSDGWSTLWFARNANVNILYSIDNNPATLEVCMSFNELRWRPHKIVYAASVKELGDIEPIDLLFLDAENDAEATVGHFRSMEGLLVEGAMVLIDDVSGAGNKGDLIIPLLEDEGWMVEIIGPMALARREV